MFTNDQIATYYDRCEVHYKLHWNLAESLSMHYGFWDKNTKRLHDALVNINVKLAQKANIQATDRVLDAGCGIGGSSIFLGGQVGCEVVGITLSDKQVHSGMRLAVERKLTKRVRFQKADFTQTPFEDASFDVIWAIESVCHAEDKKDFLQEAYRLLKPNGRLILADFFRKNEQENGYEEEMMQKWEHGWAVPRFAHLPMFLTKAEAAGFQKVKTEDITPHILPSAKKLYYRFFPGILVAKIHQLFGDSSKLSMDNVWTAYYQYKTLQKDLWRYHIVSATK